jgi:formyl-CoA transferase
MADLAQRNKRSVALDLSRAEGRELRDALVRCADVVAVDGAPGERAARGLDPDSLAALHPGLIVARATGFGPQGPDRELPPLDELAAARTGMMPILPQPGQPPVYPGHGSMYSAVMLALGVCCALHHRAETGEGQVVDVSLFAGNMYGASLDLQAYLAMGGERLCTPVARLDVGNPMSGSMYRTSDGRWLTLTMPDTDRWWPGFAPLVGLEASDPRFDDHEKRCETNRGALVAYLEQEFPKRTAAHWRAAFEREQLSADVIEDYAYPARDPQVARNRYVVDLEHPSLGRLRSLGFPIALSECPARLDRLAPCAGQHGDDVLHGWLGLSLDRLAELRERGVIG